jgi:hypothetical protein
MRMSGVIGSGSGSRSMSPPLTTHSEWAKHPMGTCVRTGALRELRDHLPGEELQGDGVVIVVRPCGTGTSLTRRGESTEARWINQQLTFSRKI